MRRLAISAWFFGSACNLQPATFDAFGGDTSGASTAGNGDDDDGSTAAVDESDGANASSDEGGGDGGTDAGTSSGAAASDEGVGSDGSAATDDGPVSECGDGMVDEGEACDDADADDTDECLSNCTIATCGDGFVRAGLEECDDGDALAGDGCSHHCTIETQPPKRVFITSVLFTGAMGGLAGADAQCQALADTAGLPGTFLAWLADGASAPAWRFTHADVPYILVDGTPIAEDWSDLVDGAIAHAIDLTENGGPPPVGNHTCGQTAVWSNVTFDGGNASMAAHCAGWTDVDAIQSHSGRYDLVGADWSASCFGGGAVCLWSAPIYCFEQ